MTAGGFVRVLGAVQYVDGDGSPVVLPSAAQRRLLALLALGAGTTLRADHLVDVLSVRPGALRTAVSRLRSRLGEPVIRTDAVGYRIGCAVDATMFTALLLESPDGPDRLTTLETALAMWNGVALDEFAHEPWAQAEVSRLEELRALAIEDRAELLIARGRGGEAVAALENHIAAHPLRDRARGLLIKALAGQGRQADALRAYQDYRTFLAEETGTEPSAVVRSIERRVAVGAIGIEDDDELGSIAPRTSDGSEGPFEIPLHGMLARGAPLIGRGPELAWMETELVLARAGELRTVLVSGEAGIGKTTLLAAFARRAHGARAASVFYGRSDEGAAVPFEPFRGIVRSMVDHAPTAALRAHCERFGGELLRIAPHLSNRVWVPPPTTSDDATERYRLFEAVADLVRRLARDTPLVLVLDDLHWAEPAALLLLRHLGTALADAPVLVVASFRDTGEHRSMEFRNALADLARRNARQIALSGFDDAELADLVASVVRVPGVSAAPVLAQLQEETAGNPLYAAQLVSHLSESGHLQIGTSGVRFVGALERADLGRGLLDVVWSRVRALGETPSEVLCAASVLGLEFDDETLREIADADGAEVGAALDAAVEAGLLAETGQAARTLRFTHALVARSLYAELKRSARQRLHRRAARVLQKRADDLPQAVVVQIARHWALAGDAAAAQQWSTVAGDYALDHLAPSEAARWYERALEHAAEAQRPDFERAALLVRLGEAQHRTGDPVAQRTLSEAADLARRCGADDVLIQAALAGDRGLMSVGDVDRVRRSNIEAALSVVDERDTLTHARLLALYARELVLLPEPELRQQVARRALELFEASGDPVMLAHMASALTFALWGPGTIPLRRDLAARAVAAALAIDDPFLQFWTSRAEYFVAIEAADPVGAQAGLERMRSVAERVGEPRLRWVTTIVDAFDATMGARLDEAERLATEALELGMQIGEPDAFSLYVAQLFACWSFAGRYDELLPLVEEAMKGNPDFLSFRLGFALCCAVVGRRDEAREVIRESADKGFARIPADNFWITTSIGYAVITIELEDVGAAEALYEILEPFADEVAFNGATSQGPIAAYLGKLASLLGRHDVADAHLARALEIADAFGWRYHRATTLVAMALSQRRRTGGLDDDARAWLDEAEAIATECGLGIALAQAARVRG